MTEPFHHDLRRIARVLPRAGVSRRTLPLVRAVSKVGGLRRPRDVAVQSVSPTARVRVHRPPVTRDATAALLWVHGGGYVIGSAQQDDRLCRRFAQELGILVVAVDYRLAPEHPFPAPLEDCLAAWDWLAEEPTVDRERIAIGGASAGAGLAAAVSIAARDQGRLTPAFQLLAYPMLDDRTTLLPDVDETRMRVWNPAANHFGWSSYVGRPPGAAEVSSLAAPAREQDLSGLPATWIGVGTLDLFHDEDVDYAKRLLAAGVRCQLDVIPGAFHGFDQLAPRASVSRAFVASQIEVLRQALLLDDA